MADVGAAWHQISVTSTKSRIALSLRPSVNGVDSVANDDGTNKATPISAPQKRQKRDVQAAVLPTEGSILPVKIVKCAAPQAQASALTRIPLSHLLYQN